ncbi:MAG: low temperature requirement protein A [Mogibacterium sp.]|nr:low temperature requirement protein A [Mogibacterium sp.]
MNIFDREEKKVEYLELIYDLVFVYMVGRNNSLLGHIEGGFIPPLNFLAYVLCTLAIIQIWNFTTFYVNLFGRNGVRDHVFLLINMYLMYFIGEATRTDFQAYQTQYHIAWALILINIGVQYMIELRNHQVDVWNRDIIKRMALTLFVEAGIVLIAAIPNPVLGTVMSAVAILSGVILTFISRAAGPGAPVDFMHLTERAMLYVVFTFGEMIIAIAAYFKGDGSFDWSVIYFSLMGFLIVVGLFLSYGILYDHLINREMQDNGLRYMVIHIFIIFSLNNITISLEFMRETEVDLMPKMVFLIASIVGYYVFLFCTYPYAKLQCRPSRPFITKLLAVTAAFVVLMIIFREQMYVNILITVIYVFGTVLVLKNAELSMEE